MTENYVASTLEITINEFFEKYIDNKTVTFYKLEVYDNYSKEKWILEKRYSEIDLLHKTLSKLYPNIPPMPGKTLFKIKNRDALENRKKQLELFLRECTKRKDIESNSYFKTFLELDKHSPDLTYNAPEISFQNSEILTSNFVAMFSLNQVTGFIFSSNKTFSSKLFRIDMRS